ncbi:transporter, major facilitator family protein [Bifidobacterium dolichotidis]|uniref:Transporter, major facilitator family protein n=1 Tax=Bifidobacterium dolichotidis TaxID=2306976 RepID=A0A430FQS9_9BIFI|nr:MFS transporter [Bifidobacterium dolichotidis]RSX55202.1 transporter, major facilitator family protein [Bifidobacterium dolichotidis]
MANTHSNEPQQEATTNLTSEQQHEEPRKSFQPGMAAYVRPGIDDRPDLDKELRERDKAAIGRLGMPTKRKRAADPSVDSPIVQIARMRTGNPSVAVMGGLTPMATVDSAVMDETSAFNDMRDPMTAADGTQPTSRDLARLGIGFALCAVVSAIPWIALSTVVLPYMFEVMDPSDKVALVGLATGLGAIVALFSNVLFGALSDITRSRFGRRTPWIVIGSVIAGAAMGGVAGAETIAGIITLWCIAQFGFNMMLAPFVATLADRVPDKVRGRISSLYGLGIAVGQTLGSVVGAALLVHGDAGVQAGWFIGMAALMLIGIVTVLIWPREPNNRNEEHIELDSELITHLFRPPHHAPDFYRALAGRTLMMCAYWMIMTFQLYIAQDYIYAGDPNATEYAADLIATMAIVTLIASIVAAVAAGPIADRFGVLKLPATLSCCVFAIGAVLPVLLRNTVGMVLFAALAGLSYGVYNAIDQALNVAVLPNPKTAGKDLGILNMSNTLSTVLGAAIAYGVVNLTKMAMGVSVAPIAAYALVFIAAIVIVLAAGWAVASIRSVR